MKDPINNYIISLNIILILIIILYVVCQTIYAGDTNPLDKKNKDSVFTYGPTYSADSIQKSDSVMNQSISWSTTIEEAQKAVRTGLSTKVDDKAQDKVNPELKKKTGVGENINVLSPEQIAYRTLIMGWGRYDPEGTLINTETINGKIVAQIYKVGDIETRYVYVSNDNSKYQFSSIQDALDEAAKSVRDNIHKASVYVMEGTYSSAIHVQGSVHDNIQIIGQNASNTYLTGRMYTDDIHTASIFLDNAKNVVIKNLNLSAPRFVDHILKVSGGSGISIENNIFSARCQSGINIYHVTGMNVSNNYISGGYMAGVRIDDGNSSISITNNIITGNESGIDLIRTVNYGVPYLQMYTGSIDVDITGNEIFNNKRGGLIFNDFRDYPLTAWGAGSGIDQFQQNHFYNNFGQWNKNNPDMAITSEDFYGPVNFSQASGKNLTPWTEKRQVTISVPIAEDKNKTGNKQLTYNTGENHIFIINGPSLLGNNKALDLKIIADAFKAILGNKETLSKNKGESEQKAAANVEETTSQSTLLLSQLNMEGEKDVYLQLSMLLTNIIKNPTAEQKAMLDAAQALINDIEEMNKDVNDQKTVNEEAECLQVISAVFLAQALPDLLNENDMATIKGAFKEIDDMRNAIVSKYKDAVKPYYDAMKKEMMTNIEALQDKDMLAREMTKEAILKLSPKEMDQIIKRVKDNPDKTQGEKDMLSLETKLKAEYIEPNQKVLRIEMKAMMNRLTKKLYSILYETGLVKPM